MDYEQLEHIIMPFATAALGVLGTWLALRNKGQATKMSGQQASRDDDRDDFTARSQHDSAVIARLEKRLADLEADKRKKDEEIATLQAQIQRFRVLSRLIRQAILTLCENGATCPLTALLDDWDRETGAPVAGRKEG